MQQLLPMEHTNISDGFALNLCSVLLRLCEPFIKPVNNAKLLKIDPTYCAAVRIYHSRDKLPNCTNFSLLCRKLSKISS